METEESKRIDASDPDDDPKTLALTIVADPRDGDADAHLDRVRDVWRSVARYGYQGDDQVPIPESDDEYFSPFPEWYRQSATSIGAVAYVDDRDWIWWSGSVVDRLVKIDLRCDGFPTSTFTLTHFT